MKRRWRLRFQNRVLLLTLLTAAPAWIASALLLWRLNSSVPLRWTLFALITVLVAAGLFAVRRRVVRPLQSLANMLEALREGDY